MDDNLSESNNEMNDQAVSEETSGGRGLLEKSPDSTFRNIEVRRSLPPVIRRQIEQVPRMPGVPARDYVEMFVGFTEATGPRTVLEYQFVLDVTVATMEIQYYRRMKPLVIERYRRSHVLDLADRELAARQTVLEAKGRSRPDLFTDAQRKAVQRPYDDAIDEADAFLGSIHSLSHIDELIDAATRRRNAALQDIERYQSRFAEKLRVVSGAVIDGSVAPKKSES